MVKMAADGSSHLGSATARGGSTLFLLMDPSTTTGAGKAVVGSGEGEKLGRAGLKLGMVEEQVVDRL